jgi:hypothetical protein
MIIEHSISERETINLKSKIMANLGASSLDSPTPEDNQQQELLPCSDQPVTQPNPKEVIPDEGTIQ